MRDAVKIVLKQNIDGLTTRCILQYNCFPCALNRGFFLTCSMARVTLGMLLYLGVLTNALKKNLSSRESWSWRKLIIVLSYRNNGNSFKIQQQSKSKHSVTETTTIISFKLLCNLSNIIMGLLRPTESCCTELFKSNLNVKYFVIQRQWNWNTIRQQLSSILT